MDTLTDREFIKLFDRMTYYVDFKGCETQEDIEHRMMKAIKYMKWLRDKGKKPSTRKKWAGRIKLLRTLGRDGVPATSEKLKGKTRMGFARRAIQYARLRPRSRLSLTLTYGKEKARKILRKRLLKRLRTLARKRKS